MNEQIRIAQVASDCYRLAEDFGIGVSITERGIFVIKGSRIISPSMQSLDQLYGWLRCYEDFAKKK